MHCRPSGPATHISLSFRQSVAVSKSISGAVARNVKLANVPSIFHGYTGLYVFFCRKSRLIDGEGMKQKSQFPDLYLDFMRKWGVPKSLRRDNALEQCSEQITEINRERGIKDTYSEGVRSRTHIWYCD